MGLVISMKNRGKLFSKIEKRQFDTKLLSYYKQYRNIRNSLVKSAENLCFINKIHHVKNDVKGAWNVIYEAFGKVKQKYNHITELYNNEGNLLVNNDKIAHEFNKLFIQVGSEKSINENTFEKLNWNIIE